MAIPVQVSQWRRALPWVVAGALGMALATALLVWTPWRAGPTPTSRQLVASIGADGSLPTSMGAEWARDTLTQLTFDRGVDRSPVWTPDGRRLVFASDQASFGINNLYSVNADGTGAVTRLTEGPGHSIAASSHPSTRFLAFSANRGATGRDLMILPMEADAARGGTPGKPTVFSSTPGSRNDRTVLCDDRESQHFGRPDMELIAVLTPAEEGGFVALNPETGTTTEGETVEEAVANLREATALYLAEFPKPSLGHPVVTMFTIPEPVNA